MCTHVEIKIKSTFLDKIFVGFSPSSIKNHQKVDKQAASRVAEQLKSRPPKKEILIDAQKEITRNQLQNIT